MKHAQLLSSHCTPAAAITHRRTGEIVAWLFIAFLFISVRVNALTILSSPVFTPASNAPLAGVLTVHTDVDSRVSLLLSDGIDFWQKDFFDYSTSHSVPVLGFKPGRTNQILVTVYDKHRNAYTAPGTLSFVTSPLPANFAHSVVLKSEPDRMEPGYTLFLIQLVGTTAHYVTIMNAAGEVVWYTLAPGNGDVDVRRLGNGDLFIEEQKPKNDFVELNMLGDTVRTWLPPAPYPVNIHEGLYTDHGTILYISDAGRQVTNFPTSATDPNAPRATKLVDDNPIIEISASNSALLNVWSPLDMMDPTRVTYLTYQLGTSFGVDNEHVNAIIEDTNDSSIIISLRDQNAVFKFSRDTGQLKWILGPHENWGAGFQPHLLSPVGSPFEWNYGQHAPELTPQHTLLLYDDGNAKASPFDPPVADQNSYSRVVEYSIDETNMEVSQVWDTSQADQDRIFTQFQGDVDWLPQRRNVLVTYGNINYVNGVHPSAIAPNATMVRIVEYTHDPIPEVVFDLSIFDGNNTSAAYRGYVCYRSERIPDLYAHPLQPVTSLILDVENDLPALHFSADPAFSYLIQASTDLVHWVDVGSPVDEGGGDFDFSDLNASQYSTRFYRVVTQSESL